MTTYLHEHKKQDAVNLKVIQLPDLLHINSAPSVFIKGIKDPGQLFLETKLIMLSSSISHLGTCQVSTIDVGEKEAENSIVNTSQGTTIHLKKRMLVNDPPHLSLYVSGGRYPGFPIE